VMALGPLAPEPSLHHTTNKSERRRREQSNKRFAHGIR
jgi:hypothetical protein